MRFCHEDRGAVKKVALPWGLEPSQKMHAGDGDIFQVSEVITMKELRSDHTIYMLIAVALSALLAFAIVPINVFANPAEEEQSEVFEAADVSAVSETVGDCIYLIDSAGNLVIRPADGVSGTLDFSSSAWSSFRTRYSNVIRTISIMPGVGAPSSLANAFWNWKALESVNLNNLDTSKVISMSRMFAVCESLKYVELSDIDISNVTDTSAMFQQCVRLETVKFPDSSTLKPTNMSEMFMMCPSLTELDFSLVDTSDVSNMLRMLTQCYSLKVVILGESFKFAESYANYLPKGKWQSVTTGYIFTASEIEKDRAGVADTYLLQIDDPNSISNAVVADIPDQAFDGGSIQPQVHVSMNNKTLVDGLDYVPIYFANSSRGVALVVINGMGQYFGSKVVEFNIVDPISIDSIILSQTSFTYNGTSQKPGVTVKAGSITLDPSEYDVTWSEDTIRVGKKKITAKGVGKYNGSVSASYTIDPAAITSAHVDENKLVYDGSKKKPRIIVVSNEKELVEGTDFTVKWPADITNTGTKTVLITGTGNYAGDLSVNYEIVKPVVGPDPVPEEPEPNPVTPNPDPINPDPAPDTPEPSNPTPVSPEPGTPEPGNTEPGAAAPGDSQPAPEPDRVEMLRLYNPNSGEHFYTSSLYERDQIVAMGWNYEGVAWIAPTGAYKEEKREVYRLYNAIGGEHHYTMDSKERQELIYLGWQDEGVGWYSAVTPPYVLRLYNPNAFANNHHYTTDMNEKNHLEALGWIFEGCGWYALW